MPQLAVRMALVPLLTNYDRHEEALLWYVVSCRALSYPSQVRVATLQPQGISA
jgi:hypothetical protein